MAGSAKTGPPRVRVGEAIRAKLTRREKAGAEGDAKTGAPRVRVGEAIRAMLTPRHATEPESGPKPGAPRVRVGQAIREHLARSAPAALARFGPATLAVVGGAVLLWLVAGVGFVNYDTLYGLVWGQQLSRGETPQYGLPIAPTPHPLVEMLGIPLGPLGAGAATTIAVALGFLALAGCGWVLYRLGSAWFGRPAGIVAAAVLLTRVPILSYGVRVYVDIPYTLLVLGALLVETRRPRAGAPVLVLLALAGLLRPEAWAFSAIYWVFLAVSSARSYPKCTRGELARLGLLAAAAPLLWVASDLLVTGHPMWSLANTKHTAATLRRPSGIGDAGQYIPRRIGEVLRPVVLAGAALGGVLSLLWLGPRAGLGAAAGVAAVVVFAAMASVGLPIDTRYAFLTGAILCAFCGAGVFGWRLLPRGDRRRVPWMAAGAVVGVGLLATLPGQLRSAHRELGNLSRQQQIQDDLVALVKHGAIAPECAPVGVPNHAPVPLLALYLKVKPSLVVSAQDAQGEGKQLEEGTYVDPASIQVEHDYILDPHDPHSNVSIPPGFTEAHSNRSWLIFERCS